MNRSACVFCLLVLVLAGLIGCSGKQSTKESKKAEVALDKIQGKVYSQPASTAIDSAINAGGPTLYLWDGSRRYRLFVRKTVDVVSGREYAAEGINAQKVIDEIGDPDQGKKGYPLIASCERVVKMAWTGLGFYEADEHASALRQIVNRYPARPVFLVAQLSPVTSEKSGAEAEEKEVPEVSVAADKQSKLLIEGPTVQAAPLWQPAGETVRCKVLIGEDGEIAELQTGLQLCEAVPWSQFRYQPTIQRGQPVKVKTEIEVRFEPRK